jgi:hypothetical protein
MALMYVPPWLEIWFGFVCKRKQTPCLKSVAFDVPAHHEKLANFRDTSK